MSSTATTTSGKRKLVYKQDPDGVFRLKKAEAASTASSILSADDVKESDELCDLSYKFRSSPDPVPYEPGPPRVRDMVEAPKQPKLKRKKRQQQQQQQQQQPSSYDNLLDLIADSEKILNSLKRPDKAETQPPKLELKTAAPVPQSKVWNFFPNFSHQISFPTSIMDPRIASYIAGIVTALLVQRMAPTLSYYGIVLLNLLKLAVIAGIVVGVVCWYAGFINVSNQFIVGFLDKLKSKLSGEEPTPPAATRTLSDDEEDVVSDAGSDVSWPEVDSEEEEVAPEEQLKPRTRARSESPVKASRRSNFTNVTPFVAPPRRHTNPIITPAVGYLKAKQLERRHSEVPHLGRRESNASSIESRHSNPRRHAEPPSPVLKLHKKLPAFPNEDLPLVNEIKVSRLHLDVDDDSISDLMSHNINRQNSVMSKNSVLGTRANYDRFLANVKED